MTDPRMKRSDSAPLYALLILAAALVIPIVIIVTIIKVF